MKKILLLTVLAAFFVGSVSAQGVEFFGGTLDEALAKAKSENKRVFMDFYTDWCGPCKAVAKFVFPEAEAGDYFNARFVSMKVDAEKGQGPELAKEFNVSVFPTFIVLDADRTVAAQWSGGSSNPTPAKFIEKLETELAAGPEGSESERMMRQMMGGQPAAPQAEPRQEGIVEFEGSHAEALAKAKTEGKMVFVDCYTQWCGPCKLMAKEVFPRKDVGEYMNPRFVFQKMDMEAGEGPGLGKKFGIKAYPTYIIFDGDGKELYRFEGYMAAEQFIARISGAVDKGMSLTELQARYDAGERDKAFMRSYIAMLSADRKREQASVAVNELMASLTPEERLKAEYWPYWTQYDYAPIGSENFDYLVKNYERFGIGKNVTTAWLVNLACSRYSDLGLNPRFAVSADKPTAEQLQQADDLARKLDLEYNPTVELYRAAADAKVNGNVDAMIDTYIKSAKTILSADEQNSFLTNVALSFGNDLTQAERDRLCLLTTDQKVKSMLQQKFTLRRGGGKPQ